VSDRKRPRFGDAPVRPGAPDDNAETRIGAPLPLVTQPMVAVGPPPSGSGPLSPRQLAHTVPHERVSMEEMTRQRNPNPTPSVLVPENSPQALAPSIARELAPHLAARTPPEIGLTQHHLPEDVPPDPRLVLVHEPDSERAASFRVLRHHLLEAGRPQVVVVSSPRSQDGKTTAAVNLALALSECGRAKVLLVETHLRRPQLASLFRFVPPWCFAEQLAAHRHQPMLPWGFVDIPQLWLHVAAINPRIEQSQLLDAPAFAIAMERLRLGGYDHIVIDAPPVVGSADVNLIQDAADGTLLVVRGKRTTARELRQAIDQLNPARVLGTVLIE
jgi:Mrp family chromosome partitioning ATPase